MNVSAKLAVVVVVLASLLKLFLDDRVREAERRRAAN
jgi:hypothetical protein